MKTSAALHVLRLAACFLPRKLREDFIAEWSAELLHARQQMRQQRPLTVRNRMRLLVLAFGAFMDVIAIRGLERALPRPSQRAATSVFESLKHDVRFAVRVFARKPAFTAIAVGTLSLGIGSATTIFTILDGVLLKPLAFDAAEQLVTVWQADSTFRTQPSLSRRWNKLWFSYPEYQQWRSAQRSFREVAAFGSQEMGLTQMGDPTEVVVYTATPTLLPVLRSHVAFGRWFSDTEQGTGADRVAVLSHATWISKFGGDSAVLNRPVTLDDNVYRIIGVLPADFHLPNLTSSIEAPPSIWIPIGADGGGGNFDSSYEGIGRLLPQATVQQAVQEANGILVAITGKSNRGVNIVPRVEAQTASAKAPLLLLTAGVFILLAIACVNIAALLFGEIPARAGEFATRASLGASRSRLFRQLVTEGVVLAVASNAVGIGLAFAGVRAMVSLAPSTLPRIENVHIDVRVLLFSVALTSVAGIGFSLVPAISASRTSLGDALRRASRQIRHSFIRFQDIAIVVQAALAVVLLAGAVTLTRSLQALSSVQPGFVPEHVLTVSVSPGTARHATPDALNAFHDQLERRLKAIAGVQYVGVVSNLPLAGRNGTLSIEVPGIATTADTPKPNVQRRSVRPGYFDAMRIPLLSGRGISAATTRDEIVVDEAFARRFWPAESAVGKSIKAYSRLLTVIGVVGSVRHNRLDDTAQATLYFPYAHMTTREVSLVVRTSGDPLTITNAVRRAVWEIDPTIPLPKLAPMAEYVRQARATETYRTVLLGCFALAATLLTAFGVFGVTARAVSQQRREIGIRIALGARAASVSHLVLRQQIACVFIGAVTGMAIVQIGAAQIARFVYRVSASDWQTLLATVMILLTTTVIGILPPMCTALRINPARLIRDDS